ncbi:UBA/TS-N domain-containing protein [Phlyctema vagabunda]|uniref:UBA/TS-N domain-containing protein n=1 Tax=Phlyctema vagabunda TaxID=108571 RepID=A0ABR4PJ26_9HELO
MDDLNGLDWSATAPKASNAPAGTGNYYPTLRPTPSPANSGRSTPLSTQVPAKPKAFVPPKSGTPDSFSNLVNFGSSKSATLTLQQQQEKLQAEKRKQEAERKKQYESQFGNGQFWDGLGNKGQGSVGTPPVASRTATPSANSPFGLPSPPAANGNSILGNGDDSDLFAAFNADTKVDRSSNYPAPSNAASRRGTPALSGSNLELSNPQAWEQPVSAPSGPAFGDDDDPFGLGQMSTRGNAPPPMASADDDDDFLGDLGKPVDEVRKPAKVAPAPAESDSEPESNDPWDKAVNELVEMGFSAENSRRALTESGSGLDIQAAVGWLLNDAHRQAKAKSQSREPSRNNGTPSNGERRERPQNGARKEATPAWMREEGRSQSQSRREDSRSPASGDNDLSKTAAAVGSNLFKTANSLWKTSQKKVQKAVAEFQTESDPSQPKWMREAAEREAQERRGPVRGRDEKPRAEAEVTDEALMLEGDSRPAPRKLKATEPRFAPNSSSSSQDQSPALSSTLPERASQAPKWQQSRASTPLDAKSRLSKQALEEQTAQAYVSPSRRKKATQPPQPSTKEPEPDLLFSSAPSQKRPAPTTARPVHKSTPVPSQPSTPIPTRPKAPERSIPSVSSIALANSNQHRLAGTTHFKRGDYAAAHTSYTSSLSALPQSHPITIVLLCNRALTSLKTGIPKEAVDDANKAIAIIGVSRGEGEFIDLGAEKKDMKEFFGKALMRKAEALEQMEQWKNAGLVWQEAVESGVGGANSIQGRQRCEKALAPKPAQTPRNATPKPRPAPKPKSALSDLGPSKDSEAVERLRAANAAADKADDEKFALADSVDAKISQWRDGKRDNLRALLGSLDKILWEDSGWKKVGMHELVINSKVKIAYMKAIGKCHPDKLPQNASTEVKLIAATVFATLNESWDKFKAENGM